MKQMTMQMKIAFGIFSVVLIAFLVGGVESWKTSQTHQKIAELAEIHLPLAQTISRLDSARAEQRSAVMAYAGNPDGALLDSFNKSMAEVSNAFKEIEKHIKMNQEPGKAGTLAESMQNAAASNQEFLKTCNGLMEAVKIKDEEAIKKGIAATEESSGSFRKILENLQQKYFTDSGQVLEQAVQESRFSKSFVIIITLSILVFGAFLAFFLSRSIVSRLYRIIDDMKASASQVASSAGKISAASQFLAEGASEQASSIEETSSSLEEMSSMTKQNAGNAGQANALMQQANQVVGQANTSMAQLTTSMDEISKASEETSKIIKTIDEIAFQTNLLALNAAVEAARAGEAGSGFAVVADEVRNLAMRAADAARNTANLIEGTVKKVKDGAELVVKTNEAFKEVSKNAAKVGELVAEIAAASHEQSQGIDQVNKAVLEMDKVVQQNVTHAEESASSSGEMRDQAALMEKMLKELHGIVGAGIKSQAAKAPSTVEIFREKPSKTAKTTRQSAKEGKSDKAALSPPRTREAKPEQIIPLDDDFKDF